MSRVERREPPRGFSPRPAPLHVARCPRMFVDKKKDEWYSRRNR